MNYNQNYVEIGFILFIGITVLLYYYFLIIKTRNSVNKIVQGVWESYENSGVVLNLSCEITENGSQIFMVNLHGNNEDKTVSFTNHEVAMLLFQSWKNKLQALNNKN